MLRRNHPDDAQLLRYCDGELKSGDASRIEQHIRVCRECRAQIDDLQFITSDYARYRQAVQFSATPPAPQPWMNLQREMLRLREQEGPRFRLNAMRRGLPWLLAGCVLAAGAGAFYFSRPIPRVLPVAPAPAESAPPAPTAPPKAAPPAPRAVVEAVQTASADDELKAIAAVHDLGADLGEPVTVIRERERIVVHAAGLAPDRAAQLRAALENLPRVSFELTAPSSTQGAASAPAIASGRSSTAQTAIANRFRDAAAYQNFVDRTLELSDAVMTRIYALRSLATHFPPDAEAQLSPEGLRLLASIRNQHVAALRENVRALDRSLEPIVGSTPQVAPATEGNWQSSVQELFGAAEKTDHMISRMLAPASNDPAPPPDIVNVASALAQLKAAVDAQTLQ